jgi:hypothetical protein
MLMSKRTIRFELESITEDIPSLRSRCYNSFYMINTKKQRLEEERNTEYNL